MPDQNILFLIPQLAPSERNGFRAAILGFQALYSDCLDRRGHIPPYTLDYFLEQLQSEISFYGDASPVQLTAEVRGWLFAEPGNPI